MTACGKRDCFFMRYKFFYPLIKWLERVHLDKRRKKDKQKWPYKLRLCFYLRSLEFLVPTKTSKLDIVSLCHDDHDHTRLSQNENSKSKRCHLYLSPLFFLLLVSTKKREKKTPKMSATMTLSQNVHFVPLDFSLFFCKNAEFAKRTMSFRFFYIFIFYLAGKETKRKPIYLDAFTYIIHKSYKVATPSQAFQYMYTKDYHVYSFNPKGKYHLSRESAPNLSLSFSFLYGFLFYVYYHVV